MFDIISFIREKIFRRPKIKTNLAWEDLSEKQTTKLWYFLLFCMFCAIITSAQWTLIIIKWLPNVPIHTPNCISNILNTFDEKNNDSYYTYWDYYWYNDCQLVSTNPTFDFTNEYNTLSEDYKRIDTYKQNIQNLTSEKQSLEYNQRNTKNDYNTSLTEKIANENSWIYDRNWIQTNIQDNLYKIKEIDNKISENNKNIITLQYQHRQDIENLKIKFKKANDDYKTSYLLYRLYVAILSLIFSIIVFVVLYKIYVKQKIKNSPNTIIFSVATFAYWLILVQISSMFIWDIIPHKLIELIMKLFSLFTPLIYIVQFLWPLIIIAVFWFMVYKIQKRLYSPKNVLKRFISDKKCPNCWNSVDYTKPFCPLCSNEIQIHCPHCKELTLKWMPYCSSCWWKLDETN